MSDWLAANDWRALKPVLTTLVLAPVPWLVLIAIGSLRRGLRVGTRRVLILLSIAGLWLSTTNGAADALAAATGLTAPPLSAERIAAIAGGEGGRRGGEPRTAIVVLGGGREAWAPEYGTASLADESLQRLRYGLWLARRLQLPVAFSGGVGWAQAADGSEAEADIAARIAAADFGQPLRWIENRSRDTRENARLSIPMLRAAGIEHVLLVTHGWHMRRALRAFEAEAAGGLRVEAAPMGLTTVHDGPLMDWLPSAKGFTRFRQVSRETLGLLAGA